MSRLFSLADKTALIIGGNSGLGKAIAAGFLDAGAKVTIAGRDSGKLASAVAELAFRGQVDACQLDVRDLLLLRGMVDAVLARHGRIDILVNCQGILILKPAEEFTPEDWADVVGTNLQSVFFACTEVGRHMLARNEGAILNIASVAAYRGWSNGALYGISKHGMVGLTETLAAEWAGRGVRVNGIAPGFFMTDLNKAKMPVPRKARALDLTPMGRFGEPDEIVGAAIYLASPAARYVTGEIIRVDGGFLARGL
jgi:NAD(P)-dependent dehydrogenase (short-subunit alcohol dehydrogenase family)